MSSSRTSSAVRLPWFSLPAMEMIESTRREKTAIGFRQAKKSEGTGTVASADVFEAGTLGRYLKPRGEEADASGRTKGNHN